MAKMFLNMDETKSLLGRSEDEVKQFVKDGRLREFRDGQVAKYKADQVENLRRDIAASGGGGETLDIIAPEDTGISLADPPEGSDSTAGALTLADSKTGSKSGSGSKAGTTAGTKAGSKAPAAAADDTALAADLGLSGSISGVPSSGRVSGSGTAASQASRSGVDIFHDDAEKADPSAQTSIAPGINPEQMNIESAGSGSGLLDLTRESDDTSLGAELLDEIAPGASGTRRPPSESSSAASGIGSGMSETPAVVSRAPAVPVEAPDPLAGAFGMAALGGAAAVLFAAFAIMAGLAGSEPDILVRVGGFSFLMICGIFVALPVLLFAAGFFTSRG
ncbi:MAG TPA: hypothetical protein VL992_09290 [Tepidisphaeraceae bacterium]|nr:hypothetical protein [Tepidisphaeraceae bacterium]